MNDIDKLIDAVTQYIKLTGTKLFNPITGTSLSAVSKIWLNNMKNKKPYNMILEGFIDNDGRITNPDDFFNAFKTMMPVTVLGIKFNESDIDELKMLFLKE